MNTLLVLLRQLLHRKARAGGLSLLMPMLALPMASANQAGFPEVPITLFGKVIVAGDATTYQLFDGEIEVVLVDEKDETNTVAVTADLFAYGPSGIFSYKLEIDREYLPQSEDLSDTLKIASTATAYRFDSITVDGAEATLMDVDRSILETKFETRDEEFRLDLLVNLDGTDSDEDGLPDFWEALYGLNPLFPDDAEYDGDDDGWTNLEELENGSDPTESNKAPTSLTTSINVIPGARMGVYLNMLDSDQDPDVLNVFARLMDLPDGVTMYTANNYQFTEGSTVVYQAQQRTGYYYMEVDSDFTGGTATFEMFDNQASKGQFTVELIPFTPASLVTNQADIWYDAIATSSVVETGNAVSQWSDLAGDIDNSAYQSIAGAEPYFDSSSPGSMSFDGSEYLFINDTGVDYSGYTLFAAFTTGALSDDDQVVVGAGAFELMVTGSSSDSYANVLKVQQNGSQLIGDGVSANETLLMSYSYGSGGGVLHDLEQSFSFDRTDSASSASSFATMGGRYAFDSAAAESYFAGSVHEYILFPDEMDAKLKSRVDDYFIGRWHSSTCWIWDFRLETSPVEVEGPTASRNVFSGGWGNDVLAGGALTDIFRDGSGSDTLTGNGSGDVFQFFKYSGTNTITDFDYSEGDLIDLSPIFSGIDGAPDDYLSLESEVIFEVGAIPTLVSNILIDFENDGAVDQIVALSGVRLSQEDLPWLVGEGHIVMGGPDYSNAVVIESETSELSELPNDYSITLSRTGNLESALSLTVNIAGTASIDEDFSVNGLSGFGSNRTLIFARDEAETTITITPVPDTFDESESIRLSVLPETWLDDSGSGLDLVLQDAEWLIIETIQPYAERVTEAPGVVRVTRSGVTGEAMVVDLMMSGTAENGIDYEYVVPSIIFEADETVKHLELKPILTGNIAGKRTVAQVSLVPDTTRYNLLNPWTGTVNFVDRYQFGVNDFSDWLEVYEVYPDSEIIMDALLGDDDNDSILNLVEYGWGTDPTVADDSTDFQLEIYNLGGRMEIWAKTDEQPLDLETKLVYSDDLLSYDDASDLFDLVLEPQSDGTILRRYVSKFPTSGTDSRFFALTFEWIESIRDSGDFAYSVFDEGTLWRFDARGDSFLVSGDAPWVPMVSEEGVSTPAIGHDESAGFVTTIEGPFDLSFEWKVSSEEDFDELMLFVDGSQVTAISGEVDWTSVDHSNNDEGVHTIEIRFYKDEIVSSGDDKGYVRKFDVSAQ
ncbi:MAG: Calx-beta domain-containing protein [Opitutaceae bacterium]